MDKVRFLQIVTLLEKNKLKKVIIEETDVQGIEKEENYWMWLKKKNYKKTLKLINSPYSLCAFIIHSGFTIVYQNILL